MATLELSYPNICSLVSTVLASQGCEVTLDIADADRGGQVNWSAAQKQDFEKLILRYAQENIMKVNLFIKQPFAAKWVIEPHASM